MSKSTDGQIDQLVKAKWLALGLSQSDLAEVLGASGQQAPKGANGSIRIDGKAATGGIIRRRSRNNAGAA